MITHIVMWKFKAGEEDAMRRFLADLQALDGVIPQIREMQTRVSMNPANEYNAALLVKFDTLEDLEAYKVDPRHVAAAQQGKDLRIGRAAIDIED